MTIVSHVLSVEEAVWVVLFDFAAVIVLPGVIIGRVRRAVRRKRQEYQANLVPQRVIRLPKEGYYRWP